MKIYRIYCKSRGVALNIKAVNKSDAIEQLIILYRTFNNDSKTLSSFML